MNDLSDKLAALSPKQRALFELRLKKLNEQQKPPSPQITRRNLTGSCPLSLDQERLWFINRIAPGNAAYNIYFAIRLTGSLDAAILKASINEAIKRHEALRTTFGEQNGQPVQHIAPTLTVELPIIERLNLSRAEQDEVAQALATEQAQAPFDLTRGPLVRPVLLKLSDTEHVLIVTQHHIITDWWSSQQLHAEIVSIYDALVAGHSPDLPDVPFQYSDFVMWEREHLESKDLEDSLTYWRKHLAGGSFKLDLPIANRRPGLQTFQGRRQPLSFPPALAQGLRALSQRENSTMFMTLTAAFYALLFRYTNQTDITLGTPLANRSRVELEQVYGFLITMLVLHIRLSGELSFQELLGRVRTALLEAYTHQDVPFTKILDVVQPERDWSRNPLFQFSFIFLTETEISLESKALQQSAIEYDPMVSRFDMTLIAWDRGDAIAGCIEYNTDLFTPEAMTRFADHFQTLMESIVAAPDQPIVQLPMLTEAERRQLLVEWNETQLDYPTDLCMHHLFEAQAARTPDAVAVVCGSERLTYHELNRQAGQLADHLRALGVGPDVLVGLCVHRSLDMVVGLLGILKAGGAYVALDPEYPRERQAFMLRDARIDILLTQQSLVDTLPTSGLTVLCLDTPEAATVPEMASGKPSPAVTPDHLAYILYTSGSTGQPKGVAIEHRSAVAMLSWSQAEFSPDEVAGMLASTSICFDISVYELFLPLSCGGTVILVDNALALHHQVPTDVRVTLVNTVPSAMRELVRIGGVPPSVKVVNLAGEPLSNTLVQAVYEQEHVERVYNLYGPSEDTTYSTFLVAEKGAEENPTVGRPIANSQVYIVDEHMQPVPILVPGELYLGGAGLARGYLNQPEMTQDRFIDNPFGQGRLYKTGDLARYLPDGQIEFLGRMDYQVKLRGFRIELGEIETILSQHEAVRETVVVVREDQPGDPRLVAYVVPNGQAADDEDAEKLSPALRVHLRQKLPDYMVPSAFVALDSLPLTPNGKIDRLALPAPEGIGLETSYVAPDTPTEETLAAIWAEVLGVPRVGRHDDFFELGGHSLLAIQIMLRTSAAFEVELPLHYLLHHPNIAEFAQRIDATQQALANLQDTEAATEGEREEVLL